MPIPVIYKNITVREPLYLDILVQNRLIIEVKASSKDLPYYYVQLGTYLRLTKIEHGLLINFGKEDVKEGIFKMVNSQLSETRPRV